MPLEIHLCDRNPDVVKAWKHFFGRGAKVNVTEGDALALDVSAVVSPANSFGIMHDGFAAALNKHSGGTLESRLRQVILERHAGELPIGQAEILTSGVEKPLMVVVAPTQRVPARLSSANVNSFLATRAALRAVAAYLRADDNQHEIESLAFVGMGTGGGQCSPATAAFQMYEAYCQIVLGKVPNFATIEAAVAHDTELRKGRFL